MSRPMKLKPLQPSAVQRLNCAGSLAVSILTALRSVLGFAGVDGHGLEGVERDFDHYLRGKTYSIDALRDARGRYAAKGGALPVDDLAGYSINLSLDVRIQQVAERALLDQIKEMDAKAAVAVVMDVRTGDLLAIAQTAFDLIFFGNLSRRLA